MDQHQEQDDLSRLSIDDLVRLGREPSETPRQAEAVLEELRGRRAPEENFLLLCLLMNIDLDEEFRLDLAERGCQAPGPLQHAVWWLLVNTEYGHFEHGEYLFQVVDLVSNLKRDDVSAAPGLMLILANPLLDEALRTKAGLDLVEALGDGALSLLPTHLGTMWVSRLEDTGDDRAASLLERIALDTKQPVALRLTAASSAAELWPDGAEGVWAAVATSDGLSLPERLQALEEAVSHADSAAANAALAVLTDHLTSCAEAPTPPES